MNVRNLKDMFQRKQSIPQNNTDEVSSGIRPKNVTQGHIKPSVSFNYSNNVKKEEEKGEKSVDPVIQQPRVSVRDNKKFMEELNRKIGRETHLSPRILNQNKSQEKKNIPTAVNFNEKTQEKNVVSPQTPPIHRPFPK